MLIIIKIFLIDCIFVSHLFQTQKKVKNAPSVANIPLFHLNVKRRVKQESKGMN